MNNLKTYAIYTAIALGGILIGTFFFGSDAPDTQSLDEHIAETHTDEDGTIIYSCSMHPNVRQNEPGNCPICGMQLVPINTLERASLNPNTIVLSDEAVKLAEIQTSAVRLGSPQSVHELPGKIMPDQNKSSSVTALFSGRVEELYADYVGASVVKGQKIASIYSPELIVAQQELLETLKYKEQNSMLYKAARQKLALWELPESTINAIESTGEVINTVDIVSPTTGIISELTTSRQDYLKRGDQLFNVVDLSSVWVMLDAYESDIASIELGQMVHFMVSAYPGEHFTGTVDFIDPLFGSTSRTTQIRVEAQNTDSKLKPNMLVVGEIESSDAETEALMIPKSAVLWTGKRSLVFVQLPNNTANAYEGREVTLGKRVGDDYIVLDGLTANERVVTNGTFKLDSAAQLEDKLSMMNRNPGSGANRTGHEGHTMEVVGASKADPMEAMDHSEPPIEAIDHSEHQMEAMEPSIHQHTDHLDKLVNRYLAMTAALENDQFQEAMTAVKFFAEEVQNNPEMIGHENHSDQHNVHHGRMVEAVTAASNVSDIESLRPLVSRITNELIIALENQNYAGNLLYKQYCPMYQGGAYWLSSKEDSKNPYFGAMMPNCGEAEEEIGNK